MFHGVMPVQGGAHRPRLEEWHPFSAQVANDDDGCANKQPSSSRNLTYITRLHPCATAPTYVSADVRIPEGAHLLHPASHAALGCSPSCSPRPRLVFRPNQYSHAPRSLWNTSHCKPKSGTMGRQRLYPST